MDLSRPFLERLNREYRDRRRRNAAYSLRSFSRDLEINPGRLSQYFSGARSVTPKAAQRMMARLGLSPLEQAHWLGLSITHAQVPAPEEPALLEQKVFELISEPIHFTILSLMETRGFKNNPRWIATRIRSSVPEVTQALRLLRELGLAEEREGRLVPTQRQGVRSSDGVRNAAVRRAHERQLREAAESLDRVPIELRDLTSMTIAADPAKLGEARELIKEFRRKLSALLESGSRTEVYRLQVQLIPLTEVQGETKNES